MQNSGSDFDSLSDKLLLQQWYAGNERSFEILYKRYYTLAISFSLSLCFDPEESREITQATFVRIVRKVHLRKGKPIEIFKPYLYASLTKNYLDRKKRKASQKTAPLESKLISMTPADDEDEMKAFLNQDILHYVLKQLNENQRSVYLRQIDGYSVVENAADHDMSNDQVRGLLYRARKWLRDNRHKIMKQAFGRK